MTMLSRMRAHDPFFDCFSRGKSCGVQWSDGGGEALLTSTPYVYMCCCSMCICYALLLLLPQQFRLHYLQNEELGGAAQSKAK